MERGREFSSSEEFARSLEPHFTDTGSAGHHHVSHEHHQNVAHQVHHPHQQTAWSLPKFSMPRIGTPAQQKPKEFHPHHHHRRKKFEVFAAFYLFLLLALIMFLSFSTDTGPFIVLLALLPTIFTVVIAMIVYEAAGDNKHILWVIPLILIFAFHAYGTTQGGIIASIDINVVTALNIFASFFYLIVNYFLLQTKAPAQKEQRLRQEPQVIVKEVIKEVVREKELPDDLAKYIASIEDKSKALNFVIGRVYNAYHGGSKEARQKINMRQEWYDQFSTIPANPSEINFVELSALITTIESRLRLLEKSEVEIFGAEHKNFKNLVRDSAGKDKIIDVLDKNDKDPVKNYIEGALQFCGRVKDFMKKREAPVIENKYVIRPDEEKKSAPRTSSWTEHHKLKK